MHEWYEDHAARNDHDLFEENKDMAMYEISATQKYASKQLKRLELQPLKKNVQKT